MVRGLAIVLALAALAAGCSRDDGSTTSEAAATSVAGGTTEPTTTEEAPTTTTAEPTEPLAYQAWFTRGDELQLTWVEGEKTVGVLTQAMLILLTGPSSSDDETAIPADTELINIGLANGTATIDLSGEFFEPSGLAVAQVVYTATQYPTVRAVRILVEGQKHPLAGTPLRRRYYLNRLPPIVVQRPTGLEPVDSTFTVSGSANVFEANVTIRVLDENGDELFTDFTTATCGTGCRGRYKKTVTVDFDGAQSGTLVVQDDDADGDGKPSYEVRIPLEFSG
jgi:hypothetical protein